MKIGQIDMQPVKMGQVVPKRPKIGQIVMPVQPKPKLMY